MEIEEAADESHCSHLANPVSSAQEGKQEAPGDSCPLKG